ncbi:MAG: carbohydrate kinase family protein [Nanobdellota archaeon]
MEVEYEVLALAESMVDINHEHVKNDVLKKIGLEPGSWNLYEKGNPDHEMLLEKINQIPVTKKIPGSSPGNTLVTMSQNSHKLGLITATGDDENGKLYLDHMNDHGIDVHNEVIEGKENPFLHVMFSDGERTFFAYTGCTPDININKEFPDTKYFYLSGYEVAKLGEKAVDLSKRYSGKVVLDFASSGLVKEHRDTFKEIVSHANILFTSSFEYEMLFGHKFYNDNPRQEFSNIDIMVLKLSKEGSLIINHNDWYFIPSERVPQNKIVNTNGCGDVYAAGFLSDILNGYNIEEAGYTGSDWASQVLRQERPYISYKNL